MTRSSPSFTTCSQMLSKNSKSIIVSLITYRQFSWLSVSKCPTTSNVFVITHISVVLHPYFGIDYINHKWGGEEEQQAEIEAGDADAKNWQEEALRLLENKVRTCFKGSLLIQCNKTTTKMDEYWKCAHGPAHPTSKVAFPCATALPTVPTVSTSSHASLSSMASSSRGPRPPDSFDAHCRWAVPFTEGWRAELRHYLEQASGTVMRDMDLLRWWQVCILWSWINCRH